MRLIHASFVTAFSAFGGTGCNAIVGGGDYALAPENVAPDAQLADASVSPDAAKVDCKVIPELGIVASSPATTRLIHRTSDGGPSLLFLLNTDPRPDALSVQLYNGMGGHGVLDAVGTYSVTSADTDFATCGFCALIEADFDTSANTFAATFLAMEQGTLTLTKADSTGLAGSMRNLKLRHVEISSNNETRDVGDGCTVTIGLVEFDVPYAP